MLRNDITRDSLNMRETRRNELKVVLVWVVFIVDVPYLGFFKMGVG